MTQDDFFICKAEEEGVAVATATDVGAADENQTSQYGSYLIFDVLDTRYAGENLRRSHISITDHSVTSNVFLLTSV